MVVRRLVVDIAPDQLFMMNFKSLFLSEQTKIYLRYGKFDNVFKREFKTF